MNKNENEKFYTSDLSCAAALITVGIVLLDLDKSNPKRAQFGFGKSNKLNETIQKFWANDLKVVARAYMDNLKMLKTRIYSE